MSPVERKQLTDLMAVLIRIETRLGKPTQASHKLRRATGTSPPSKTGAPMPSRKTKTEKNDMDFSYEYDEDEEESVTNYSNYKHFLFLHDKINHSIITNFKAIHIFITL